MKPPLNLSLEADDDHQSLDLRILIAERPGGVLTGQIADFPADTPIDFEVEDNLAVAASLAAGNVFDLVVIGESLFGEESLREPAESLADAARTTPILILGAHVPESLHQAEQGTVRIVAPKRLNANLLLREIRHTLEEHVLKFPNPQQERRMRCLRRIFDSMIERMPYPVAVTDAEGRVCVMNRAAQSLWSGPPEEVVGSVLIDHPESCDFRLLTIGPPATQVEASPVPIDWLGREYFLTSLRKVD